MTCEMKKQNQNVKPNSSPDPSVEKKLESPAAQNDAPALPLLPVGMERPTPRPSSNARRTTKGGKGGSKSGGGKSSQRTGSSTGTLVGRKPKKKKAKRGMMVRGWGSGTSQSFGPGKKAPSKKSGRKAGPRKRY